MPGSCKGSTEQLLLLFLLPASLEKAQSCVPGAHWLIPGMALAAQDLILLASSEQ